MVRRRKRASITITVRGNPPPRVTWYVGRNRKPVSSAAAAAGEKCFRCEDDGQGRHTLVVTSASGLLDHGVWVVADNRVGRDACLIDVKTYRGQATTATHCLHTLQQVSNV